MGGMGRGAGIRDGLDGRQTKVWVGVVRKSCREFERCQSGALGCRDSCVHPVAALWNGRL